MSFNFPNGINALTGLDMGLTQGKILFVRPGTGSDGNDGLSPKSALKTLVAAHNLATANQNDIVYLMFESNTASATTDYQTTALTWSKDNVHLIGVGAGPMLGQRARIAQLAASKTIVNLVTVSANNCLFANLEIFQGVASSTALAPKALVVTGMRNRFVNCQISGNGDTARSMDVAGARSLYISGSENIFQHCYVGLETCLRDGTAEYEIELVGTSTANVQRTIFEDCIVSSYTSADGFVPISATYIGGFLIMKNCIIHATQQKTSATKPAAAIKTTTPNGDFILMGTSVFGFDNVAAADATTGLWASGYAAHTVDGCLGALVDIT